MNAIAEQGTAQNEEASIVRPTIDKWTPVRDCSLSYKPVPSTCFCISQQTYFLTQPTGCWMNYFSWGSRWPWMVPGRSSLSTHTLLFFYPLILMAGPEKPRAVGRKGIGYCPSITAPQSPPGQGAPCNSLVRTSQDVTIWLCCHGRCWGSCKLREESFITCNVFLTKKLLSVQRVAMGTSTSLVKENAAMLLQLFRDSWGRAVLGCVSFSLPGGQYSSLNQALFSASGAAEIHPESIGNWK